MTNTQTHNTPVPSLPAAEARMAAQIHAIADAVDQVGKGSLTEAMHRLAASQAAAKMRLQELHAAAVMIASDVVAMMDNIAFGIGDDLAHAAGDVNMNADADGEVVTLPFIAGEACGVEQDGDDEQDMRTVMDRREDSIKAALNGTCRHEPETTTTIEQPTTPPPIPTPDAPATLDDDAATAIEEPPTTPASGDVPLGGCPSGDSPPVADADGESIKKPKRRARGRKEK